MGEAAILLAAGESARMGEPKPLLRWGEGNLIEYQLEELAGSGLDDIVVVLGHEADLVRPLVDASGARAVLNGAYREGRASSLRAGACALRDDFESVLITNVDQPRPRALLRHLLDVRREGPALVAIPTFEGRRGHPTAVAGALLEELRGVGEESLGLRGLLERHAGEVHEVAVASPLVLLDLNTPEEYERARRDYSKLLGLTRGFGGL